MVKRDPLPTAPSERPPEESVQVHLERSRQLLEVTHRLAGELDRGTVERMVAREAAAAFDCQRADLFLPLEGGEALWSFVEIAGVIRRVTCPTDQGIVGRAASLREVVFLDALAARSAPADPFDRQTGFATCSGLAAPLVSSEDARVLAVLALRNRRHGNFEPCDEQLLASYCRHAAAALERVTRVERLGQRRTLETSLEVARTIQRGFMPDHMPRVQGYEAATWWRANEAVGGDYCDVIPLKNQQLALAIGDVSGHGLGPSLIMATVRAALHALVLEHTDPEVLLNLLGRSLCSDLKDGRFITMFLGVLDPADHSIQYANAGHAPALRYQAATGEFFPLESTGMPLGIVESPAYHQGWPFTFEVGDMLVLATDGMVETLNQADERFGLSAIETIIRRSGQQSVEETVRRLGEAVMNHCGRLSPPDDLTVLVVRRKR